MPKIDTETLAALARFAKGQRVTLGPLTREGFRGRAGVVIRAVKSRGVVTVCLDDDGRYYDAYPRNVIHIEAPAPTPDA